MNRAAWCTLGTAIRNGPARRSPPTCTQHRTAGVASSRRRARAMKVAVVGCAHGELDAIYDAIREIEKARKVAVELVICAGDFQAVRNEADLACMACPDKFKDMRTFWKYYAGRSKASIPTVFVGGNHEASNHLQQIPLGGLVAPNMYFLGNAGVINFRGLRIGGISGVYTEHNYEKPRYERPPYPKNQKKTVYHSRKVDVDRLMRLSRPIDIFISHDWPRGITDHGNLDELLAAKPFLRSEIQNNTFGNPGAAKLLYHLQPRYWFSAHIHVKFPALVKHVGSGTETKFLALDKALPRRDFIQLLDIPIAESTKVLHPDLSGPQTPIESNESAEARLQLDPEWLAVLRTEGIGANRDTPATEEEIQDAVNALTEKGVDSSIRTVSDFERSEPPHSPKKGNVDLPEGIELQERTAKLIEALGLSTDSWSNELPIPVHIPSNAAQQTVT